MLDFSPGLFGPRSRNVEYEENLINCFSYKVLCLCHSMTCRNIFTLMPETDSICCSSTRGWKGHALTLRSTTSWRRISLRYIWKLNSHVMWFTHLQFNTWICKSCTKTYFHTIPCTVSSHISYSTLPLCLQSQVELDLKRLRDPLQLQLPIQQLTTSKNWWE